MRESLYCGELRLQELTYGWSRSVCPRQFGSRQCPAWSIQHPGPVSSARRGCVREKLRRGIISQSWHAFKRHILPIWENNKKVKQSRDLSFNWGDDRKQIFWYLLLLESKFEFKCLIVRRNEKDLNWPLLHGCSNTTRFYPQIKSIVIFKWKGPVYVLVWWMARVTSSREAAICVNLFDKSQVDRSSGLWWDSAHDPW